MNTDCSSSSNSKKDLLCLCQKTEARQEKGYIRGAATTAVRCWDGKGRLLSAMHEPNASRKEEKRQKARWERGKGLNGCFDLPSFSLDAAWLPAVAPSPAAWAPVALATFTGEQMVLNMWG